MTRRTDRYSTTEIEGEDGANAFPTADKIFPQGEPPKLGIPRINAAQIQSENEKLKGQLAQLQEMLNQRPNNALDVQTSTFAVGDFFLTPTGLQAPENFSFEDWEQIGHLIFRLEGAIQWLIGDWLVYGADLQYGDLVQIAEVMGRDSQTFYHMMSTCRKIELCRRRQNLSFAHHSEVKAMTPDYQTKALEFAEAAGYNVKQFRKWIKLGMPDTGLPEELPASLSSATRADDEFISLRREVEKLRAIGPSKLKPREREAARSKILEYIRQVNREAAELRQEWEIDEE